jgi:hypothetical protein
MIPIGCFPIWSKPSPRQNPATAGCIMSVDSANRLSRSSKLPRCEGRSMGKRNRSAWRNTKKSKLEGHIHEPTTAPQSKQSEHAESTTSRAIVPLGDSPTTTGQTQTDHTSEQAEQRGNIVRFLVALWRGFVRFCAFCEAHHGFITAAATVAIVALTIVYVTYSKRQWETMTVANRLSTEALQISNRGAYSGYQGCPSTRRRFGCCFVDAQLRAHSGCQFRRARTDQHRKN